MFLRNNFSKTSMTTDLKIGEDEPMTAYCRTPDKKKFKPGDTISIEAKVMYAYENGDLDLMFPDNHARWFARTNLHSAKLVKKATPKQPPAGSILRSKENPDALYLIDDCGLMQYIGTHGNLGTCRMWDEYHDNVEVVIARQ